MDGLNSRRTDVEQGLRHRTQQPIAPTGHADQPAAPAQPPPAPTTSTSLPPVPKQFISRDSNLGHFLSNAHRHETASRRRNLIFVRCFDGDLPHSV